MKTYYFYDNTEKETKVMVVIENNLDGAYTELLNKHNIYYDVKLTINDILPFYQLFEIRYI